MIDRKFGCCVLTILLSCTTFGAENSANEEILIADFEGPDYGEWVSTGEAFGPRPAQGTLPKQMKVSGYEGKGLASSFHGGDPSTGTLTSPSFKIQRQYINFLIGGGDRPGETCINLIVDGKTVRTATGPNDRPGGSERLDWHTWDVGTLLGKSATLKIVDRRTSGWGHIAIDQIALSDKKRQPESAQREVKIMKRYLHLPVRNGAAMQRMKFVCDGETVREFDIELADGEPDFWVFSDMSLFQDKEITIEVDGLSPDSVALRSIVQADEIPEADTIYKEKYRPQFHFSSRRGWNNDPNGLVYSDGEYHLYYQHNPYGWKWGNMHWGHAVSEDLVHWKELPLALYPQIHGDWCYSGGAMLDKENTAGFKTGSNDVIVATYTSTGRGECIAYSNDRGRTFTEYEGNPVVEHRGRDPKVIWFAPGKHWVMAVYDEQEKSRGISFYTSTDLKEWTYQSRIDGYFECPEIFELPVDGNNGNKKWVLYAADGDYTLGAFDGKAFQPEGEKLKYNYGNCYYASQTFSDIPESDGRRIQIAWGRVGHKEMPFNQMMDFPVELTLRTTDEGIRMFAEPVREIETLYTATHRFWDTQLQLNDNPLEEIVGELFDIECELSVGQANRICFEIRGLPIVYDCAKQEIACRDKTAPLEAKDGKIRLRLLVDRISVEIFANDGRMYMPMGHILEDAGPPLHIFAEGGTGLIETLTVRELRSSWE